MGWLALTSMIVGVSVYSSYPVYVLAIFCYFLTSLVIALRPVHSTYWTYFFFATIIATFVMNLPLPAATIRAESVNQMPNKSAYFPNPEAPKTYFNASFQNFSSVLLCLLFPIVHTSPYIFKNGFEVGIAYWRYQTRPKRVGAMQPIATAQSKSHKLDLHANLTEHPCRSTNQDQEATLLQDSTRGNSIT